jgi:carboxylesterase
MAGHGTSARHLATTHWEDWYHSVLAGLYLLRNTCQQVFCVGVSMGGAFSLMLAANEQVAGVVTMSAPYGFTQLWRRPLLQLYGLVGGIVMKPGPPPDQDPFVQWVKDQQRARGEPVVGRISYREQPAVSIIETWDMLDYLRTRLPEVKVPVLMIHSRTNNSVPFSQMQMIFDQLCSVDKQMVALDKGRHNLPEDPDHLPMFEMIGRFIKEHT